MDYYGADRKLSELGEQDLDDFLDQDMFTPPASEPALDHFGLSNSPIDPVDNEWLDNFFDDPVLNDRMMTDALQPRRVQSEHSYSLTNGEKAAIDDQIKTEPMEKESDFEDFLSNAINPNMTLTPVSTTITSHGITHAAMMSAAPEVVYPTLDLSTRGIHGNPPATESELAQAVNSIVTEPATVTTVTRTNTHPQTLLKQPTIILATQQSSSTMSFAPEVTFEHYNHDSPTVNIKVEPVECSSNMSSPEHTTMYDSIGLPPTPPSSTNSDSDGSLSPQRSAPPSPIRHSHQLLRQHVHTHHTLGGVSAALSQPLFTSPIPSSGMLLLSDEEKRTLISEGYPIPHKLPLTKQEEKNLKKIRRKIKNKISAQESRRKKKEYLETLEKKVESYNSENSDLKKKLEHLENNNRSLISQLHKLQAMVAKVPRPSTPTTQTGTCLMVLVLFFAVFVGTWSPFTWSIGYSSLQSPAGPSLTPPPLDGPTGPVMGPDVQQPMSDPYATPSMKSRVLLSTKDDVEEAYGPHVPFSYHELLIKWFSDSCRSAAPDLVVEADLDFSMAAPIPSVMGEVSLVLPDSLIADNIKSNITAQVMTPQVNTTA